MEDWKTKYVEKLIEGFLDFLKDKSKIPMKDRNLPDNNRDSIVIDQRGRAGDKVDLNSPLEIKHKEEDRVAPYIDRRTDAQHKKAMELKKAREQLVKQGNSTTNRNDRSSLGSFDFGAKPKNWDDL